jgi:sterol 3beta-glucosyltransferase
VVVPPPDDLPRNVEITGYWFLDDRSDWKPDGALAEFLAAGEPPIYVGFSSVVDREAARTTDLMLAALDRSGRRAILATGWGGLARPVGHRHVFAIEQAPHDRLLPSCIGILHHGGAGTTGAALRAGLPQIVVPFMTDQPFWADRVRRLGVAALTAPKAKLTVDDLCTAFRRLGEDRALRNRAAELARHIRAENGLAVAIARLEAAASR